MPKFLILYNSSLTASQAMEQSSPEQVKASMAEWIEWKDRLPSDIKFEWGMPLQADSEIGSNKVAESHSRVGGYSKIEGDKAKIIEQLKNHPHLKRPDSTIDLMQELPMEGMEG